MRIDSVRAVLAGYRKIDPDMERSFALVRIETDDGTVGWGESSTNWGHSYPTVFRAAVDDVCSRHLEGRDPLAIRDRVADLQVALDGYLGWEGLTSQTIGAVEIALWDILGKTLNAPVHQLLGGSAYPIPCTAPAPRCSKRAPSGTPTISTSAWTLASRASRCVWAGPSTATRRRSPLCGSTSAETS